MAARHTLSDGEWPWAPGSWKPKSAVVDALSAAFPHTTGFDREPDLTLGIDPAALTRDDVTDWMSSGRLEPFAVALDKVGYCANPVQLRGSSLRVDTATGEIVSAYSSADEPGGVTYVACGNRREDACPYCSRLYARDAFHLIRAGIVGGKTVPEHVADNPLVFATLTAPSFGQVHGRRDGTGLCHPSAHGDRPCEHGRPRACPRRHDEDDELLGRPLCEGCYDYESHLVWHWWAPDLFRRFTIALRRSLAKDLGVPATRLNEVATVQYAKVAEPQRRAAIHFHVLIRLDGPRTKDGFAPADSRIDSARLAWHVRRVTEQVRLEVPGVDERDPSRVLAFGRQVDARPVTTKRRPDDPDRDLAPEQVAGYLAKYLSKSVGGRDGGNDHHRRLRAVCRSLADRAREAIRDQDLEDHEAAEPPYAKLGKWVHMYGFRGRFSSKSRRYSITLGALRRARARARVAIAESERTGVRVDLAAMEAELLADEEEDEATLVIGSWEFAGTGWANETERVLALTSAARARQYDRDRANARQDKTA